MANVGRFLCVALPFLLCLASLISMLVAGLAGVADKSLYLFQINTTDLSIDPASIKSIADKGLKGLSGREASPIDPVFHDARLLGTPYENEANTDSQGVKISNITAADLALSNLYDISLWGYCNTAQNGERTCTQPAFNWADGAFKDATNKVENFAAAGSGQNITLPKEIKDAMNAFGAVTRWTEIVFIIAYVALGLELFLGLFANCSRAVSCITWIVAGLATTAVCVAASLATAMAAVVVGTVESTAKFYGVKGAFNTRFLVAVWLGATFALAAGFFWIFTICCCKPEKRERSKKHRGDKEKLMPTGAYAPLADPEHNGFYNQNNHNTSYGAPRYPSGGRSDLAYEPYSHHGR